jgi:glycine hydroxymethyltransferase
MSVSEGEIIDYVSKLRHTVNEHEKWRTKTTLNLLAAENFASEGTRSFLSTDLSNRYTARDKFYRGTKYADEVEQIAVDLAKKLYGVKYADVRPLSGHTCSLILFMSFLKPGDKVVTCPPKYGGYPGTSEEGLGPLLHLKNLYFPYNPEIMNIIPAQSKEFIRTESPELSVFGSSFIPFPYDIRSSLPENYSGVTVYDGSHVMGLIAGGEFQRPLSEGCSILMGSTHKTLFGPQGGLILSNDEEVFSVLDTKVFPGIIDNVHLNRVAGLAFALIELLKFGRQYAAQIVRNSKILAKTLDELGVPVKCKSVGFTKSHQVLLGYGTEESVDIADRLQDLDIVADTGIRVGTAEVTRRGMKENEMEKIGSIIADALIQKRPRDEIRSRVHNLVSEFGSIEFALN